MNTNWEIVRTISEGMTTNQTSDGRTIQSRIPIAYEMINHDDPNMMPLLATPEEAALIIIDDSDPTWVRPEGVNVIVMGRRDGERIIPIVRSKKGYISLNDPLMLDITGYKYIYENKNKRTLTKGIQKLIKNHKPNEPILQYSLEEFKQTFFGGN